MGWIILGPHAFACSDILIGSSDFRWGKGCCIVTIPSKCRCGLEQNDH